MVRVSVATPGRSVTTYKSGKNGSASRRPGSTLKNNIIKRSPAAKHARATRASKSRKAVVQASSQSDEECSSEGSDSGDSGSDEAEGQEEEEFDPELRNLVHQSGLKAGQFRARPHKDTPTASRTHVSRYRASVLGAGIPTGPQTVMETSRRSVDEDTDSGSTSTSGDEDVDDVRELARPVKAKSTTLVRRGNAAEGKENMPTSKKGRVAAEDREQGRKFGKDLLLAEEPRIIVPKRSCETVSRHIQQTSKVQLRSRPQPVYARAESKHRSRVYEVPSSDTEAAEPNDDQQVFGIQDERGVLRHNRGNIPRQIKHRNEKPKESRDLEEAHSRMRDYEHLRPEMAPAWRTLTTVFHDINEKMRMHKNKVNDAIVEELKPMHEEAEKIYNHLAGHQTEKMLSQQNLMENALNEHYDTLHSAKHHVSSERKRLQEVFLQLKERYHKVQESRDEALTRAKKMVEELEETQAQNAEGPKEEWRQVIERAKAKAEKLLDPAVLSAKFAKQRKYIFQEVGI